MLWANILLHLSAIGCVAMLAWMIGWQQGYAKAKPSWDDEVRSMTRRAADRSGRQ